jgi:predicted TIM-barrel fold metal-dependent hydrolase
MNIDELVLVSVDDHVVEPPDLFEGRMPKRFADRAPRFESLDNGTDRWLFEGQVLVNVALNAVAGRPQEELGLEPMGLGQVRKGTWDVHERIKDMDANGVLASMCFPSFPRFAGQLFSEIDDKELALATIQAYNDWHIEGWCGEYPDRLIPLVVAPFWDAEVLAAEVRRTAKKGARAITFSENASVLGYPSVYSDFWDPFWQACSDEQVVVCMHIGSSSELVITAPDAPVDTLISLTPLNIVKAAADLVWSPVLRKFPDLTVALSEGGIGWIPYFLERVDYIYDRHHLWTGANFENRRPSEVFLDQVVTCWITDIAGMQSLEHLNVDMLTWECDYPHADSMWPESPESLPAHFQGVSDENVEKITHLNAERIFRVDPISAVGGREHATVGALRARAADHDISVRASGTRSGHSGTKANELLKLP